MILTQQKTILMLSLLKLIKGNQQMKKRTQTNRVIFHHSLSSASTKIDEIRSWHIKRGFCDIGYHYVIYPDGERVEGRDKSFIGAHALGNNFDSIGVCLIGDFHKYEPTEDQIICCERLYHQLCRYYSKSLKIAYHRIRGRENSCPGNMLNRYTFSKRLEKCNPYPEVLE